jgi:DNA (cytosine-5)-methyltransferase 1
MKVAGLFAGIGGLELGLHQAGHETVVFSENWAPAASVLAKQFDGIPNEGDVGNLEALPADVELVTAGFPCQVSAKPVGPPASRGANPVS